MRTEQVLTESPSEPGIAVQAAIDPCHFEPLLTAGDAAKLLRIHEKTMQAFARSGKLPAVRVGRSWRFRASTLDAWVKGALQLDIQSRRES